MPRIECNIEEFNWRPIEVFNTKGPFDLEGLEAKTHDDGGQGGSWNEGFSWARPKV